jgi:hypothetical protein
MFGTKRFAKLQNKSPNNHAIFLSTKILTKEF